MAAEKAQKPGLAILGAGTFTRTQYLPIFRNMIGSVSVKYIWSRSQDAAETAVLLIKNEMPSLVAKWGAQGLNEILQDDAIHGVAIVLAAQVQLEYVLQALKSGKHVLQEKPVGPSVLDVQTALSTYHSMPEKAPIWAVAENYRFEPGLIEAARLVKEIGTMMSVETIVELPMNSSNPYFSSPWRRDSAFKGGFVLDGGVHFIAGLRLIAGCEVEYVSANARHVDLSLPAPDNVSALLQLSNGCPAVLVMSYSCVARKVSWRVLGSKGTVEVERALKNDQHGYLVTFYPLGGNTLTKFFPFAGVEEELKSFVSDIVEATFKGKSASEADKRSGAIEAYHDVAVIEAMLKSSNNKGCSVRIEQWK